MTNKKKPTQEEMLNELKTTFETLQEKVGQLQKLVNEAQGKKTDNNDKLVFHDTSDPASITVDFKDELASKLNELYPKSDSSAWTSFEDNATEKDFNYYLNVSAKDPQG